MNRGYYYRKRIKSGFARSEMANLLGIDCKRYELIERGKVKMPRNLIDKFNEIINKGKEKNIDRLNRERDVNEFWDEYCVKNSDGDLKIKDKMNEFNISTYNQLAHLLGYKDGSIFCHYFNAKNKNIGFDFKNKLYSFFENELNIQEPISKPKKEEKRPKPKTKQEVREETEWFSKFDLKIWMETNNMSLSELSRNCGIPYGTIVNMVYKKTKPYVKNIVKLKKYVDSFSAKIETTCDNEIECKQTQLVVDDVNNLNNATYSVIADENWFPMETKFDMALVSLQMKLTLKYQKEIESISESIENYKQEIKELEEQIATKNNILAAYIREMATYERIIKDINEEE